MKNLIYIIGIIVIIYAVVVWSNWHDEKIEQSATKYEQCVMTQYGVSPAYWYQEHGSYPDCK